jgi:hypothetical protein
MNSFEAYRDYVWKEERADDYDDEEEEDDEKMRDHYLSRASLDSKHSNNVVLALAPSVMKLITTSMQHQGVGLEPSLAGRGVAF